MRRVLITLVVVLVIVSCMSVGPTAASKANENPLADAGLDQTIEQGTTVILDATGSRDPDGTIVTFEWTIETPRGRVITPAEPTRPRTTFVAAESGRYRVSVVVKDNDGASTRDTLYVTVNRNNATNESEPAPQETTSPDSDAETDTRTPDTQNQEPQTDTDSNTVRNDTDTNDTLVPPEDPRPPVRNNNQTVEVVRYVAEDIDLDVTDGDTAVDDNKLPGASTSESVNHTEIDKLVNALNVFQQGGKELIFGRERQSYSFITSNLSKTIYENSPKTDHNGYETDSYSDGPTVGLNKEYVDFRRVSDRPVDDADVYKVHVVVQGEKGLIDYVNDLGDVSMDDIFSIDDTIRSGIDDLTHDYSSETNDDRFGDNTDDDTSMKRSLHTTMNRRTQFNTV